MAAVYVQHSIKWRRADQILPNGVFEYKEKGTKMANVRLVRQEKDS